MVRLIDRHDPDRLTTSASLLDNVLFGRVAHQVADAADRIGVIMKELFCALDLYERILSIGLQFDVGAGGKRLTMAQRQKLNLARALLKHSDFTIVNKPLSALDQRVEEEIMRCIIQQRNDAGRTAAILWVSSDPHIARIFDRVLLFQKGHLMGSGNYLELSQSNAVFREMLNLQS
jgi:putative ABC transport system ATP-binding protein